jgi:hypothetical protein
MIVVASSGNILRGSSAPEIDGHSMSSPSASRNFQVWYRGILRLCLGLAQITAVVWCFVLFVRHGINASTMRLAFVAAGFTTVSLVLFKILDGKPRR